MQKYVYTPGTVNVCAWVEVVHPVSLCHRREAGNPGPARIVITAGTNRMVVLVVPGWERGRRGEEIVGAHVVGAHAGDLIQEFSLLMAWRWPTGLLARTVAPYPTFALGDRQTIRLHWRQARQRSDPARRPWLTKLLKRLA